MASAQPAIGIISLELKNPENAVTEVADGSIVFKDVAFKYSKKAKKSASDPKFNMDQTPKLPISGQKGRAGLLCPAVLTHIFSEKFTPHLFKASRHIDEVSKTPFHPPVCAFQ